MRTLTGMMVCLAVVGFCVPQPLWAATQAHPSPAVSDVKLHESPQGTVLIGQVQDQQGAAQAGVPVRLYSRGREMARSRTGGNGFFGFHNLRGGVYQVAAASGVGTYRVWTPNTAPPSAQEGVLVIGGEDLVRGRAGMGRLGFWLTHPLVIAAGIGTAIAVPVALHNAKEEEEPVSP